MKFMQLVFNHVIDCLTFLIIMAAGCLAVTALVKAMMSVPKLF